MKKFLKIGIALMLAILTCAFVLVSCGDKDESNRSAQKGEEVSRSEWVKALNFSGVKSFSFSFEITEDDSEYGLEINKLYGTYDRGTVDYDYEYSYVNGKNTENSSGSDSFEVDSIIELWAEIDVVEDFFEFIEDDNYLGYNEFEYNSKTGAYEAIFNDSNNYWYGSYKETYFVSIKFVDGYLASVVVTIEGKSWGAASGYSYDNTYTNEATLTFKNVK